MTGNVCKLGKKLDKAGLALIKSWRLSKSNWQELVRIKFEYADDIIATIEEAGEGWKSLSLDSFNNLDGSKASNPIKTQNQFFVSDDNVNINYNGDRAAATKMMNDFRKSMVKASMYNVDTGRMVKPMFKPKNEVYANALNENIYEYKKRLIATILDYLHLGISANDINFTSPEVIVNLENLVIAEFSNISDNLENAKYLEARDAYTILKNFDNLIKRECPYIGIKPKYSNNKEGFDKYTYEGVNTEMFTSWTTKEEVDINGQMSKTLSTLLSVFPKVLSTGKPIPDSNIPLREFHQVATKFKDWLLTTAKAKDFDIVGTDTERDFNNFKNSILRLNTRTKEDFKLARNNMMRAFQAFATKFKSPSLDLNTVRGILAMFNSKLDDNIKDAFWTLMWKTEPNIGISYSIFNNDLSGKLIQDNYKEVALYHIYDDVKNAVEELRFTNTEKYNQLKTKYDIKKDGDSFSLTIRRSVGNPIVIKFTNTPDDPTSIKVGGTINTNIAKELIADFLNTKIPANIETYIQQLSTSATTSSNTELGRLFLPVIGLVIAASDPNLSDVNSIYDNTTNSLWNNTENGLISETRSSLNTKKFYHLFGGISELLGLAWHTNISNTLKNGFGNNVAAFTLTSEIHNTRKIVSRLKYFTPNPEKNSFSGNNVIFDQIDQVVEGGQPAIGRPVVRQDVTINGKKKASRDLNVSENAFVNIFSDFYTNLVNKDSSFIYLQPTCFSDKNTHFIIPFNKKLVIGRDKNGKNISLSGVVNAILDPTKRALGESQFTSIIFRERRNSYKKILDNLVEDYFAAFTNNQIIENLLKLPENESVKIAYAKMINPDASITDKLKGVKELARWVKSSDQIMQSIIDVFNSRGLDFTEELFYSSNKAEPFNETLEHNIRVYCNDDGILFGKRIQTQLEYFIKDLEESGLQVYKYSTPGLYKNLQTKLGKEWFNEDTKTMKFYRIVETSDGEQYEQINPILSAYFYTCMLLNNDYSEIIFGRSFMHPSKEKPTSDDIEFKAKNNVWPESYYDRMEASRLLASFKRTVIAGATTHTFYPSKYGVDPTIRFAVVKDLIANVYSMVGEDTDTKALDGSGFSSPIQSYLENMSLYDAKVGMDKKTIFGDTEGKYGTPSLLKWAVFALTNERRRNSFGSDISYEALFRKMHNIPLNTEINLSEYYSPKPLIGEESRVVSNLLDEGRSLTEHEYLYRFDPDTNTYWRIDRIEYDSSTKENLIYEVKVNKSGMVDRNSTPVLPRKIKVEKIYDIDQALGGAYCMKLNTNTSTLEWSDSNITTAANIICHKGLKDKMIGYLVNTTAIKVGARNINPLSSLSDDNDFRTSTMSLAFGGVQMDADHEIGDGTTVTEMSQMISALIQEGLETEEVVQLYSEIGQVVINSLQEKNMLAKSGNFTKLHTILGKELIKTFSSGSKNTIGLAQSLLMSAAKSLKENANIDLAIPFSEPSIMGAFISDVVSNINKTGIRRKFAGIASVLCPSRGSIQYYNYDGGRMLYTKLASLIADDPRYNMCSAYTYIKEMGRYDATTNTFHITDKNGNDIVHPFINPIKPIDIDSGQTIVIVTPDGAVNTVVVDSFGKFDKLRNLGYMVLKNANGDKVLTNLLDCKIFNWSIKPVDLRQSDTTFQINGVKHSIYDLDSVRSAHYINEPLSSLLPEELEVIKRCVKRIGTVLHSFKSSAEVREAILNGDINNNILKDNIEIGVLKKDIINVQRYDLDQIEHKKTIHFNRSFGRRYNSDEAKNLKTILENYVQDRNIYRAFEDISITANAGTSLKSLYMTMVEIGETVTPEEITSEYRRYINSDQQITDINTRFAEVIMGRINAASLGLREGDDISDVTREGYKFFKKRLTTSEGPLDSRIDKNSYDLVVKGANKENIYVVIRGLHETIDPVTGKKTLNNALEGWVPNKAVFEESDGDIYYNNKKLCKKGSKEFYSRPGVSEEAHLLVVDTIEEAQDLVKSEAFTRIQYNYTSNNAETLLKSQFKKKFDSNGVLKDDINLRQVRLGKYIVDNHGGNNSKYISNGVIKKGTDLANLTDDIIKKLNDEQRIFRGEELETLAKIQYATFIKQLEYVGARIPTQSMQSFMGLQLVSFTDSKVNEVYVPAVQTWLEGSDYDIDKLYIMSYSLSHSGALFTVSRLKNYLDEDLAPEQLDTILALNRGSGITYKEGSLDGLSEEDRIKLIDESGITRREVEESISLLTPDVFNRILASPSQEIIFSDDVEPNLRKKFLTMLNIHSTSTGNETTVEEGLKNSIVNRMLRILKKPTVQIPAHLPISMDSFHDIASQSVLSLTEKRLTSDNPLTNFIMQVQNMVGKDVIGITAVGMKVFFATSTMVNSQILKIKENLEQYRETQDPLYLEICHEILSDLVFTDPLGSGRERIIANANLKPVLDILRNGEKELSDEENALLERLQSLEETKDNVNAAEGISQLLSCATDNAKELILSKINATVDFADAWVYLMSAGYTPDDISDIMMSPAFSIVQKYNKNDIFSSIVSSGNKKKTIEFVLGVSNLPGVNNKDLKIIMGSGNRSKFVDDNTFLSKLFYETYTETEYNKDGTVLHSRGELMKNESGNYIPRNNTFGLNISDILNDTSGAFVKGSDLRAELFSLLTRAANSSQFYDPKNGPIDYNAICNLLSDHIYYLLSKNVVVNDYESEEDYESNYEEDQFDTDVYEEEQSYEPSPDEYDLSESAEGNKWDFDPTDDRFRVSRQSLQNLYNYLRFYLIPKNKEVDKVGEHDMDSLTNFYNRILPSVEEQTILGSILSVNQGIKTNLEGFMGLLRKVENFINVKLTDPESRETPHFNIISFLNGNDTYKEEWIKRYEKVKSSTNILRVITETPNFKAMFAQNALVHNLLQHSAFIKISMNLEKGILEYVTPNSSDTSRLTEEEWKILTKYVRDTILFNWIASQNIQIKSNVVDKIYFTNNVNEVQERKVDWSKRSPNSDETINLSTFTGCATFVHLMETKVFDELKNKYLGKETPHAFVDNLTKYFKDSKMYGQKVHHLKLAINSMMADEDSALSSTYSDILKDFNNIYNEEIDALGGMTIGDAFFLYNLIVYKNAFTENGFTRLFETLAFNKQGNYISKYLQYFSDLDNNKIDYGMFDKSGELQIKEDGTFNLGQIKGNINDLLRRLAFNESSAKKFNVVIERDPITGEVSQLLFQDDFGNPIQTSDGFNKQPLDMKVANANDFCWELPAMSESFEQFGSTTTEQVETYNSPTEIVYRVDSKVVAQEVLSVLANQFNLKVGDNVEDSDIITIRSSDIPSWDSYLENKESSKLQFRNYDDYLRVISSTGFVHNGKIWINLDNLRNDTVFHEIMHLILGGMRFNPETADSYYKAIQEAYEFYRDQDITTYNSILKSFGNISTDFKEELLVKYFSDKFSKSFLNRFSPTKLSKNLTEDIIGIINDIFETDLDTEIDTKKLANTKLSDFITVFKSKRVDTDNNDALIKPLIKSEELKTIKRILIENGKLGKNSKIVYNC